MIRNAGHWALVLCLGSVFGCDKKKSTDEAPPAAAQEAVDEEKPTDEGAPGAAADDTLNREEPPVPAPDPSTTPAGARDGELGAADEGAPVEGMPVKVAKPPLPSSGSPREERNDMDEEDDDLGQ